MYEWLPPGLELLTDTSVADWVDEALLPWRRGGGVQVGQLVPTGFEAYGRILHPARRRISDADVPVTWAEVARERGKRIHPEVQLPALVGEPPEHRVTESVESLMPEMGSIPVQLCPPLIEILARHTGTPDRCLFCLWDGFGFLGGGSSYLVLARQGWRGHMQRRANVERPDVGAGDRRRSWGRSHGSGSTPPRMAEEPFAITSSSGESSAPLCPSGSARHTSSRRTSGGPRIELGSSPPRSTTGPRTSVAAERASRTS